MRQEKAVFSFTAMNGNIVAKGLTSGVKFRPAKSDTLSRRVRTREFVFLSAEDIEQIEAAHRDIFI